MNFVDKSFMKYKYFEVNLFVLLFDKKDTVFCILLFW